MGGACTAMPMADPRCPSIDLMGVFTLPSCCTAMGDCGLDGAQVMMPGCTDLAAAKKRVDDMGFGLFITIPAPKRCDAM